MEKKNLYISDLDGTLVENGKNLNSETINLLNNIITDDRKEFIISSARNYENIKKRIIGLKKGIKIISRNGTIIYDEKGNVIFMVKMEEENVRKAIKYSINQNLCPVVIKLIENKELSFCNSNYINEEFKMHSKDIDINYLDNFNNINLQNVIAIYAFGKINSDYHLSNLRIRKDSEFIQISSLEADKGKALEFIKKLGLYNSVTSFGNDENDYTMLNSSDNSYYIYDREDNRNNKYKNIPFDNAKSIFEIINKGGVKNENINDT